MHSLHNSTDENLEGGEEEGGSLAHGTLPQRTPGTENACTCGAGGSPSDVRGCLPGAGEQTLRGESS